MLYNYNNKEIIYNNGNNLLQEPKDKTKENLGENKHNE